jgi:DNA-binding NarL/FixJ family response regulator
MTLARMAGVIGFARGEKDVLSRRETDIIEAISAGMLDREIAMMLYIELATIKTHVRSIKDKLKARTRAEAVAIYAEMTAARGGSS